MYLVFPIFLNFYIRFFFNGPQALYVILDALDVFLVLICIVPLANC